MDANSRFTHPTLDKLVQAAIPDAKKGANWLPGEADDQSRLAAWMLTTQMRTNIVTAGEDWYAQDLAFAKAAAMEAAEALDHRTWEWWAAGKGKGKTDNPREIADACAVELADVILFTLSAIMQDSYTNALSNNSMRALMDQEGGDGMVTNHILSRMATARVADAIRQAHAYVTNLIVLTGDCTATALRYKATYETLETEMLMHCAQAASIFCREQVGGVWQSMQAWPQNTTYSSGTHLQIALSCALALSVAVGVNPIEGFTSKSALFNFRINNGYKTGTYQKIWAGHEDNYYLPALTQRARTVAVNVAPEGTPEYYKALYLHLLEVSLPNAYVEANADS